MFGPSCSTSYNDTESLCHSTGYNAWYCDYTEYMPNVPTTAGHFYYMTYGWYCAGVGLWTAIAYIGGVTAYGNQIYCP